MLWLCRSPQELRRILRVTRQYQCLAAEQRSCHVLSDKRILRSVRLSLLWAVISLQLDRPLSVAFGIIGVGGLLCQNLLYPVLQFVTGGRT
ncbi:hypothetical protein [Herbaspirillum autotrophicum]|uniref:hypothetical protein n=1 Tax=Herbaspirillum autotrophicum TaxID=180195 RepID=UPI0018DDB850|nr:hypothetical protein [Herbaspirillum autotrophicum]